MDIIIIKDEGRVNDGVPFAEAAIVGVDVLTSDEVANDSWGVIVDGGDEDTELRNRGSDDGIVGRTDNEGWPRPWSCEGLDDETFRGGVTVDSAGREIADWFSVEDVGLTIEAVPSSLGHERRLVVGEGVNTALGIDGVVEGELRDRHVAYDVLVDPGKTKKALRVL